MELRTSYRTRGGGGAPDEFVGPPLLLRALLRGALTNLQTTRLVIGAVGARHQLAVGARRWKPRLEIVLLRRGVVQLTAHNVDDLVRDVQRLVEGLRVTDEALHLFPARVALARDGDELFNLLKLVHAENTERIATVRANLLTEARGIASQTNR